MVSCVQDGRCRKSIAERPSLLVWSGLVWSGLVWKVGVAGRFVQDPNRYLRSVMVSHPQSTVPPTPKQTQAPGPRSWGFVLECGVEAWGRASTAGRCAPPVSCVTSPKHAGHSGGLGGEPPPELPEVRECAADPGQSSPMSHSWPPSVRRRPVATGYVPALPSGHKKGRAPQVAFSAWVSGSHSSVPGGLLFTRCC